MFRILLIIHILKTNKKLAPHLSHYLDKEIHLTPFNRSTALALKKSLEDYAHQHNISLTTFSAKLKARNLKTVCKTFHKAGLVVPFDPKTDVGYRQLAESDGNFINSQ